MIGENAGVERVGLAAIRTRKHRVDNARSTRKSMDDRIVVTAGGFENVPKDSVPNTVLEENRRCPLAGTDQFGLRDVELLFVAKNFTAVKNQNTNGDELGMTVNPNAVRANDRRDVRLLLVAKCRNSRILPLTQQTGGACFAMSIGPPARMVC